MTFFEHGEVKYKSVSKLLVFGDLGSLIYITSYFSETMA